jgi:hypothetical protein
MTQLWAVQTKLKQEDSTLHLVDAFQKLGLNWSAFPLKPFSTFIPDFDWTDGPIVYYGSTNLVKAAYGNEKYRDKTIKSNVKLYFNPDTHRPTEYGTRYGTEWLNYGAEYTTVKELRKSGTKHGFLDGRLFIRPNEGTKVFAGGVDTKFGWDNEFFHMINNGSMTEDQGIIVNSVTPIEREFRTWIVDGECVAAVGYRRNDKVDPWPDVPQEVKDYASKMAKKYSPSKVFVLDVAETPEGLKVVEINCFHSAGFYLTEHILDVVAEVSNFVAKDA